MIYLWKTIIKNVISCINRKRNSANNKFKIIINPSKIIWIH